MIVKIIINFQKNSLKQAVYFYFDKKKNFCISIALQLNRRLKSHYFLLLHFSVIAYLFRIFKLSSPQEKLQKRVSLEASHLKNCLKCETQHAFFIWEIIHYFIETLNESKIMNPITI